MKSPLLQSLETYLRDEGRLDLPVLGPGQVPARRASRAGVAGVRRSLRQAGQRQARVQSICLVLLCLLFGLVAVFLAFDRMVPAAIALLLLLPVIGTLRRLGLEIGLTEHLREAARDLSPEEFRKLAELIYWGRRSPRRRRLEPETEEELLPAPLPEPAPLKTSILFLTSDPSDAARLRLGEEARKIGEKLTLAKLRDRFELHQRPSVRPADLSRALLDIRPELVHFSGHGMADGSICLEDDRGEIHPVTPSILADLFREFRHVRCVLLNACYAERQAASVAEHIDYVIGPRERIDDGAAIPFAVGFYQALGAGCTIEEAYRLGCIQLRLEGWPQSAEPVLVCRPAG